MKKFNYTALKLVIAILILCGVVFLTYYSIKPFINFSYGSYILQKDLINNVYIDQNDLFGLEITSDTVITEFTFIATDEGLKVSNEDSFVYKYENGMISINNKVEYYLYGDNLVYKDSTRALLEKVF